MNARCSKLIVSAGLIVVLALALVPLAGAQKGPQPLKVTLTPYENNPILTPDLDSAWEAGGVGRVRVIPYDGLLYMFYHGYSSGLAAGKVGYATSADGVNWTKFEGNPIFVPDEVIAPNGVTNYSIVLNDDIWLLYFSPWPAGKAWSDFSGDILVATAPSPGGPWTVAEEPALPESASPTDWDWGGRAFYSITFSPDGGVLFFNAARTMKAGRATSSDGLHWTKYDDPATISTLYKNSDPIFEAAPGAWDSLYVSQSVVRPTKDGWEMFYAGGSGRDSMIGYATSPDGIKWTRLGESPLLTDPTHKLLFPEAIAEMNGTHYLYYAVVSQAFIPEGIAVAEITYQ